MILEKILSTIENFMDMLVDNHIEIYNEYSFQHELGIYLRQNLGCTGYLIQFERNVSFFNIDKSKTIKKEIDIVIYNPDKTEKHGIELKFPLNGQYPESMYSFIKDIRFCEQLVESGFNSMISVVAVRDKLFYEGSFKEGIYMYFRNKEIISKKIDKPTGNSNEHIVVDGEYIIDWKLIKDNLKYYTVVVDGSKQNKVIIETLVDYHMQKPLINSKEQVSGNLGIEGVISYIREILINAKKENIESVTLVSGQLHKEIGLSNAMPTVCSAMRRIAQEYPGSIERKPETVKGKHSSTISIEYKII